MTCEVCRFFVITPERKEVSNSGAYAVRKPGVHYCHRYPQVVAKHEDDFCGEFKANREEDL